VVVTKKGERRQPSFTDSELGELDAAYVTVAEWHPLRALTSHALFEFVKQERNGFTHERRSPSELHGERDVVYGSQEDTTEKTVGAMDAATHYALAPAYYNEVLLSAIDLTRKVLVTSATGVPAQEDGSSS
jgi:hypothetical protein